MDTVHSFPASITSSTVSACLYIHMYSVYVQCIIKGSYVHVYACTCYSIIILHVCVCTSTLALCSNLR